MAVLLTPSMVKSIKTLIHKNLTANTCLPHLVEKGHTEAVTSSENMPNHGGTDISLFTSTNLRKQVATPLQTMEISNWE